jgi:hypothetical protein
MIDLTDVKFVIRIEVGKTDLEDQDQRSDKAMELLNRCLRESPRGAILGIEKSCRVRETGGRKIALRYLVYNVGFSRRPFWLPDNWQS